MSVFCFVEIKNELKKKDDEFVKTLKGQAEDVDTLLQYMSRQFVEMQNAFKEEMDEIEGACLQVWFKWAWGVIKPYCNNPWFGCTTHTVQAMSDCSALCEECVMQQHTTDYQL